MLDFMGFKIWLCAKELGGVQSTRCGYRVALVGLVCWTRGCIVWCWPRGFVCEQVWVWFGLYLEVSCFVGGYMVIWNSIMSLLRYVGGLEVGCWRFC